MGVEGEIVCNIVACASGIVWVHVVVVAFLFFCVQLCVIVVFTV